MSNLPAHATKHVAELAYTLPNGRTIWLGAQVLSVYLYDLLGHPSKPFADAGRRKRVVELGAGTGLLSLSLLSLGYEVLATDLDILVEGVLKRNIEQNEAAIRAGGAGEARIERKVLDWFEEPSEWVWRAGPEAAEALCPPFDIIVTADTVYEPSLSQPLLRALRALSSLSPAAPVYLALERRDPALVTSFLSSASEDWGFKCSRIEHARLRRVVEDKAGTLGWEDESEWDGIEVYKLKLGRARKGRTGIPSVVEKQ
ncbi:hypothetical protein JCM10213v2_001698 [Rhodosporidiobolus nylandii]